MINHSRVYCFSDFFVVIVLSSECGHECRDVCLSVCLCCSVGGIEPRKRWHGLAGWFPELSFCDVESP